MLCPKCQTANPDGQRFCGTCGQTLAASCPQCQASNPPQYNFCGQCGASLSEAGALTLARSGLITRINDQASRLLGYLPAEMQGKAFSLFVKRQDLVVFFTHWNELLSQGETQSFEIGLNHKAQKDIGVRLACSLDRQPAKAIDAIHLSLTEVTDRRAAAAQIQTQQEMLGLTLSIANQLGTLGGTHLAQAVEEALKKICLFTKADLARIHGLDRAANCLEALYQWRHPSLTPAHAGHGADPVPLAKVKPAVVRLRREKTVVVEDMAQLAPPERDAWRAWYPDAPGAAICHLIYSGAAPIGVIGVAKAGTSEKWVPDGAGLVRFLGDLVAERLPAAKSAPVERSKTSGTADKARPREDARAERAPSEVAVRKRKPYLATGTRPLLLEKFSGAAKQDHRPVFPREDGLVLLTCEACGHQEPVSAALFDQLGKTIAVSCSCGNRFAVVLEKRRAIRKSVRLQGYFSVGGESGAIGADGTLWGMMVVEDLSKAGLRFTTAKANLLRPGDLLTVRFNLDNTNQALINKPARVVAVTGRGVGCRFEGADNYDITLGFYLM